MNEQKLECYLNCNVNDKNVLEPKPVFKNDKKHRCCQKSEPKNGKSSSMMLVRQHLESQSRDKVLFLRNT